MIEPARTDPPALCAGVRAHTGDLLLHRHRFDVFTNENVTTVLAVPDCEDVILYGVALDVCNKAAIEGLLARRPTIRLFAVTDAMKPIDQGAAEPLLARWADAGVRFVKTAEVLAAGLVERLARATA